MADIQKLVVKAAVLTLADPFQRKSFYANGRHWILYCNMVSALYTSSVDGVNWESPIVFRVGAQYGHSLSVDHDGVYVHYVNANPYSDMPVFYGRGFPGADGLITWDPEQLVLPANNLGRQGYWPPDICVDSNGYPWIILRYGNVLNQYNGYPLVIKSSTKDGTWTTEGGYPLQLTDLRGYYGVAIVPLNNGKVYATYASRGAHKGFGRLYDGNVWEAEEVCQSTADDFYKFAVVAYEDDVHMVYVQNTPRDIIYRKRTFGFGWEAEVNLHQQVDLESNPMPAITVDQAGDVYCFWRSDPLETHIYYRIQKLGVWSAEVDWMDIGGSTIYSPYAPYQTINDSFTASPLVGNGYAVVLYRDSNFRIGFAALDVGIEPPITYALTIAVAGQGTTNPAPGQRDYDEGSQVSVTAIPTAGWMFDHWEGNVSGTTNPIRFFITQDMVVTAVFTEIITPPTEYSVSISVIGQGTTSPASGSYVYDKGTSLPITAIPAAGWMFDHWEGDITETASTIDVPVLSNMSIVAVFIEEALPPPPPPTDRPVWFIPLIVGSLLSIPTVVIISRLLKR